MFLSSNEWIKRLSVNNMENHLGSVMSPFFIPQKNQFSKLVFFSLFGRLIEHIIVLELCCANINLFKM